MTNWREVQRQIRIANPAVSAHDMRPYWRLRAYEVHSSAPECIVRARAFESVLTHACPYFYEGEEVAGSIRSFMADSLTQGSCAESPVSGAEACAGREQRDFLAGFDHTLADYPTLLDRGIDGYIDRARIAISEGTGGEDATEFLQSVLIVMEAFRSFIFLYARGAGRCSASLMSDMDAVAGPPPRTFRQAVQLVWMTHLAFWSEGRHHMALGRIDQYLYPFYQADIEAGRLDESDALEIVCHLWVRLEEIAEVQNICIGGVTPEGSDATNALSYICLEATRLVQSPYANLSARFHDDSPIRFHRACFDVIRTGVGFPAIFNDHVTVPGLERVGIPSAIARDYCMVGCIETMLAGRQQAWSDSRFNTPLCMLSALKDIAALREPSYTDLVRSFKKALGDTLSEQVKRINRHFDRYPSERFPDPFLSALTQDCIGRGKDINDGGALYPRFHGVAFMGLATTADSLAALKRLVFESGEISLEVLSRALRADFEGYEVVRQMLVNKAPKYGNDTVGVEQIAAQVVEWVSSECLKYRTSDDGRFVPLMAANIQNISAGREVGATPDGRRAFTPLSDAASPYFGNDREGPTAFLQSVAVPDYTNVFGGTVINMRFDPDSFCDACGVERFRAFTEFFVKKRIPQLQFNFTSNETLRTAQKCPAAHRNLVVRVSGFSAYFVDLDGEVQEDIVRRRAHG